MNATHVLRARCEQAIATLPFPRPFTLTRFLWAVGQQCGRRIELVPSVLGASTPCGVLVGTDKVDFICYAANTSPLHARHIVLHEVGHIWLGHQADTVAALEPPELSKPSASSGAAGGVSIALAADLLGVGDLDEDVLEALRRNYLPDLPLAVIKRVLGRTLYDAQCEREAELFALLAGPVIARAAAIPAPRGEGIPARVRTVFDVPVACRG